MVALFEEHLVFVEGAYGTTAIVLATLLWATLAERRARRRQLDRLESREGAP